MSLVPFVACAAPVTPSPVRALLAQGLAGLSPRERRAGYPLSLWERAGVRAFLVAGRNNLGATPREVYSFQV